MTERSDVLRVAIIGGGISGLSIAYFLFKQARPGDRPLSIELYERKRDLGGNADTVVVDLGDRIDADGQPRAYLRWADLGVNDVNLATYVKLKAIMADIGYLERMKPLQNSACYFNAEGSLGLVDDEELIHGVSRSSLSLSNARDGRLLAIIKLIHRAALRKLGSISPDYTVGIFFDECLSSPRAALESASQEMDIFMHWDDPQIADLIREARDSIYYPRISAMYFTDERGPAFMPLSAPFEYYRLQEGEGEHALAPQRRYFEQGAQKWLEALGAWLMSRSCEQTRFSIRNHAEARVFMAGGKASVSSAAGVCVYDVCAMATQADDSLALLSFEPGLDEWSEPAKQALSMVQYTHGFGVCHTYAGVMPANQALWRSYNVLQRPSSDLSFPYRMSYVENLHQNDPANPAYAHPGLPLFFISMVKSLDEIPAEAMLDRVSSARLVQPDMLANLPCSTQRELLDGSHEAGYPDPENAPPTALSGKAWAAFKHNVLNAQGIYAQHQAQAFNEKSALSLASGPSSCPLFFGGGWTRGAGLQEQCIEQSELIASWISRSSRSKPKPFDR